VRRNSGLYKLGHGKKSVIWYWEFDMQRQYFHQFKTIDYAAAVEFYVANKFTMWEKKKEGHSENNTLCCYTAVTLQMNFPQKITFDMLYTNKFLIRIRSRALSIPSERNTI